MTARPHRLPAGGGGHRNFGGRSGRHRNRRAQQPQERAQRNRIRDEEVEECYRQRSLLKRSVYPEDIAEAVAFFASERSGKSTGNIINVDAGNAGSFTR